MKMLKKIASVFMAIIILFSVNMYGINSFIKLVDERIPRESFVISCVSADKSRKTALKYNGKNIDDQFVEVKLSKREYKKVLKDKNLESVELNNFVKATSEKKQSPYLYSSSKKEHMEWNIDAVGSAKAHKLGYLGKGVKVAVLDSGVDSWALEDVGVDGGVDFVHECENSVVSYDDLNGHGTAVMSIIGAPINGNGLVGVAPECKLYAVKVLDKDLSAPISRIIEGLDWCIKNDMDVVNLSFGTYEYSYSLENKIQELLSNNIVVVAAAGNTENTEKGLCYPAKNNGVISVGSVKKDYSRAKNSAVGKELSLSAPGEEIKAVGLFGGYSFSDGTSVAAPHIAGVVALLKSKSKNITPDFVSSLLTDTAKNIGSKNEYGAGFVDVKYALENFDYFYENYDKEKSNVIPENESKLPSYAEDDKLVAGMWEDAGHNKIIDDGILVGAQSTDITFVKQVSAYMDDNISSKLCFHGKFNYVRLVRYLFDLADNYQNTANFNHENWSMPSYYQNIPSNDEDVVGNNISFYTIKNTITSICNNNNAPSSNPAKRKWVVVGILAHLIGDIYAHRTIVPYSAVQGTNPSTRTGTKFGTSDFGYNTGNIGAHTNLTSNDITLMRNALNVDSGNAHTLSCRCWGCFQRMVELGVTQFYKIKCFTTSNGSWYEDYYGTGYFYARRLRAASYVLWQLYAMVYYNDQNFSTYFLLPGIYGNEAQYQLKVDLLWQNSLNVKGDDGWLTMPSYYVYTTFLCNKTNCTITGRHYVVDDNYYQEDMPFLTDRYPANCKLAFES